MTNDEITLAYLNEQPIDYGRINAVKFMAFACRESLLHLKDSDPSVADDEKGDSRCAAFVGSALWVAIELAERSMSKTKVYDDADI